MIGGKTYPNLIRLRVDGSIDDEFANVLGAGPDGLVRDIANDTDGGVLIAGSFGRISNLPGTRGFGKLFENGGVDRSPVTRFRNNDPCDLYKIARVPDTAKIYVSGLIVNYTSNYMGRVSPDGVNDFTFNQNMINQPVRDFVIRPDGGVVAGGAFTSNKAYPTEFGPAADGRLWIGGNFTQFKGATANYLTRLHGDDVQTGILSQPGPRKPRKLDIGRRGSGSSRA